MGALFFVWNYVTYTPVEHFKETITARLEPFTVTYTFKLKNNFQKSLDKSKHLIYNKIKRIVLNKIY